MTRRSLFAALFAPLVAKIASKLALKPASISMRVWRGGDPTGQTITRLDHMWFALPVQPSVSASFAGQREYNRVVSEGIDEVDLMLDDWTSKPLFRVVKPDGSEPQVPIRTT
jgi:hypothetical protein